MTCHVSWFGAQRIVSLSLLNLNNGLTFAGLAGSAGSACLGLLPPQFHPYGPLEAQADQTGQRGHRRRLGRSKDANCSGAILAWPNPRCEKPSQASSGHTAAVTSLALPTLSSATFLEYFSLRTVQALFTGQAPSCRAPQTQQG